MTRPFVVEARDASLAMLGPVSDYASMSAVPRFNAVGSWQLIYPASSKSAALLAAGGGVRILRRGNPTPLITGPVVKITETSQGKREPLLTFSGVCDNVHLTNRLAYPVPGSALASQSNAYDVRTGVAETVMRQYVSLNAGPSALTARRTTGLVLEADLTRGASVSYRARFDNVLALLQALATTGGVGFRVVQLTPGGSLTFQVYVPTDRSSSVKFSTRTGSLGAYSFEVALATATAAIVGDAGAGTGRAFAEYVNATAEADWHQRIETFVDQSHTTNATEIAQAGGQALATGAPTAQVSFSPVDRPGRRFGVDYGLGDKVTIETVRAGVLVDTVREATIAHDSSNGVTTLPLVGGPSATSAADVYTTLRGVLKRVGLLERRR